MKFASALSLVALVALLVVSSAFAAGGDFEKCNLQGWKSSADGGRSYWKVYDQKGRKLVKQGGATLPRPFGRCAVSFVQNGPSDGSLVKKIHVPKNATALSVHYFFINQASPPPIRAKGREYRGSNRGDGGGPWFDYGEFSHGVMGENQFFSIDLIRKSAGGRTTKPSDILARCYSPTPGVTPSRSMGWRECFVSLHRYRGKTVKLRIAAVDNSFFLNVGLDDLLIKKAEPSFTG